MPASGRIIGRPLVPVNGARGHARTAARRLAAAAAAILFVLAPACWSRERSAEKLDREAARLVERGDLEGAVARYERIQRDYPGTKAADRAREEAVLYRGLIEAGQSYPIRRARDLLVQTGRAVERFHERRGTWPATLDDLVPEFLATRPIDPWGRPLAYRGKPGGGYVLSCYGADGAPGGDGADADIVVEDGEFVGGAGEGRR